MKKTVNMNKLVVVLAVMGCVSASDAVTQAQSGLFNDPATWGGVLPGPTDNVLNGGYNLAVTTPYTTTGAFQTYGGDTEITASGSVTANLQHLNGTVRLTGGSLHGTGPNTVLGQVTTTVMDLDNGTALFDTYVLLKTSPTTININSGSSFTVVPQLALEGSAAANVNVNSGGVLTVGWVHFQGGASEEKITVNGGVFNVMENNALGSLAFAGANASVQFDDGAIVWQGIDDQADYDAFATVFDGWVDAGRIHSANWTDAELKDSLTYTGGNAVAAIPEPGTLGLVAIFGGAVLWVRRFARI